MVFHPWSQHERSGVTTLNYGLEPAFVGRQLRSTQDQGEAKNIARHSRETKRKNNGMNATHWKHVNSACKKSGSVFVMIILIFF